MRLIFIECSQNLQPAAFARCVTCGPVHPLLKYPRPGEKSRLFIRLPLSAFIGVHQRPMNDAVHGVRGSGFRMGRSITSCGTYVRIWRAYSMDFEIQSSSSFNCASGLIPVTRGSGRLGLFVLTIATIFAKSRPGKGL